VHRECSANQRQQSFSVVARRVVLKKNRQLVNYKKKRFLILKMAGTVFIKKDFVFNDPLRPEVL